MQKSYNKSPPSKESMEFKKLLAAQLLTFYEVEHDSHRIVSREISFLFIGIEILLNECKGMNFLE